MHTPDMSDHTLARGVTVLRRAASFGRTAVSRVTLPENQGRTLALFRAQLVDLRDTSLTLQLNLSTFGPHPRVTSSYMGNMVGLSRAESGKVSSG